MMQPYYSQDGIQIWLGDCRDILPLLGPVDHVVTDPPYARDVYVRLNGSIPATGSQGRHVHHTKTSPIAQLAVGDIGAIDDMLDAVAGECGRVSRRWVLVFSDVETTGRWRVALEAAGLRYVRTGVWIKPDAMPQMSGDRPAVGFEPATICHAQGAMRWNGGGRTAVWTHYTVTGKSRPDHPCPKPLGLLHELVILFTDPGDLILDPFMGSGTTLVACKRLARRAIGIELNERYCEIAANRLRQAVLPLVPVPSPTQADLLGGDAA